VAAATASQGEPSWSADLPTAKIDYVFLLPGEALARCRDVVINERNASDHRPLVVVLEWLLIPMPRPESNSTDADQDCCNHRGDE
jgi:endonuclease/exonuclease/phosphatase family metal-dependent hydrolase